jgi:hypothetical protein
MIKNVLALLLMFSGGDGGLSNAFSVGRYKETNWSVDDIGLLFDDHLKSPSSCRFAS